MMTFFRTKVLPSRGIQLIVKTVVKWQRDRCLEMGAALSYYAIFSIFPIFLIIVSIVGFLLGPDTDVYQKILAVVGNYLPPEPFKIVQDTLLRLNERSVKAGIVAFFLTLFAASTVFGALKRSVNIIWKVDQKEHESEGLFSAVISLALARVFSFCIVISTAVLLFLSLLFNITIEFSLRVVTQMENSISFLKLDNILIAQILHFISSFLLLLFAILLLFYYLPFTQIGVKDIFPAAILTTVLLMGLQELVSHNIISIGAQFQSYGAIGGVMILMLWIYLTCQIFFIGCEFSYIYTHLFGSRRNLSLEI